MKLRRRVGVSLIGLVVAPLALVGFGIRRVAADELGDLYADRTRRLSEAALEEMAGVSDEIRERLAALGEQISRDRPFTRDLGPDRSREDLDYAGRAMRLAGLDALQIVDGGGKVLSSGHFRNEFGKQGDELVRALIERRGSPLLVQLQRPSGVFLAIAHIDSVRIENRRLHLIAGVEAGKRWMEGLALGSEMTLVLESGNRLVSTAPEPTLTPRALREARFRTRVAIASGKGAATLWVVHSDAPLSAALRRLDAALALLLALAALGTLAAAWIESRRISEPLAHLADVARRVDLEGPPVQLDKGGEDEIGTLQDLLAAMLDRLRDRSRRLRAAERRAALGEIARQVNHDVRNGIAPIRNALRHLSQVAEAEPGRLAESFQAREETLRGGLAYLEELARGYAGMRGPARREPIDFAEAVRAAVLAIGAEDRVELDLAPDLPKILADGTGLRRIAENLIRNALEASGEERGGVRVALERSAGGGACLRVADRGSGIAPEDRTRIFEPFFTTRAEGTGLGLSIVQRLVADFEGRLELRSEPGRGATFSVLFPAKGSP